MNTKLISRLESVQSRLKGNLEAALKSDKAATASPSEKERIEKEEKKNIERIQYELGAVTERIGKLRNK